MIFLKIIIAMTINIFSVVIDFMQSFINTKQDNNKLTGYSWSKGTTNNPNQTTKEITLKYIPNPFVINANNSIQ